MRFHDVPDAFHKQEDCKKRGIFQNLYTDTESVTVQTSSSTMMNNCEEDVPGSPGEEGPRGHGRPLGFMVRVCPCP